MIYSNCIITIENGLWCAWDRGTLIASGSKSYVFSVIDAL
jgi:hypothetical protein